MLLFQLAASVVTKSTGRAAFSAWTTASTMILASISVFTLPLNAKTPTTWCHFPLKGWNKTRQWSAGTELMSLDVKSPRSTNPTTFPLWLTLKFFDSLIWSVRIPPCRRWASIDLHFSCMAANTFWSQMRPRSIMIFSLPTSSYSFLIFIRMIKHSRIHSL